MASHGDFPPALAKSCHGGTAECRSVGAFYDYFEYPQGRPLIVALTEQPRQGFNPVEKGRKQNWRESTALRLTLLG